MENRRKFVRFEVGDFLEIKPLDESAKLAQGHTLNLSLMGVCFYSHVQWKTGQVLLVEYFLPAELDSVVLKTVVVWSEFISDEQGYLTGVQIIDIDKEKEIQFINYYFQRLKERFF